MNVWLLLHFEKCNDYPEREYMTGEIPAWKRCAPEMGDEIVYSANKYRETDGRKVRLQYGKR
jgi:hypothetical protein